MKKSILTYCLFSCFLFLAGCTAGYVATRPADVEYVRPVSPGPDYIWIGGEWEWRGGNYHWHDGSWRSATVRDINGNQAIGKTVKKDINGKMAIGNNGSLKPDGLINDLLKKISRPAFGVTAYSLKAINICCY